MSRDALPGLPEFEYIKPETLLEASQFLATHAGEARPMMGAQTSLCECVMASGATSTSWTSNAWGN